MRYPAAEKLEIIRLVEQSRLPVRRTLDKLGILPARFYRWYDRYQSGGYEALKDRPPRPSVDGSNPAISGHRKPGHIRRPETGVEFYFIGSCSRKDVWTLVRQLRGPHLSTCA